MFYVCVPRYSHIIWVPQHDLKWGWRPLSLWVASNLGPIWGWYLLEDTDYRSSVTRRYLWPENRELYPQGYGHFLSHTPDPALPRGLGSCITLWPWLLETQSQAACSLWHPVLGKRFFRCWPEVGESVPVYAGRGFTVAGTEVVLGTRELWWLSQSLCSWGHLQAVQQERGLVLRTTWIYSCTSVTHTKIHSKTQC